MNNGELNWIIMISAKSADRKLFASLSKKVADHKLGASISKKGYNHKLVGSLSKKVRSLSLVSCPLSAAPSPAVDLGGISPFFTFFTQQAPPSPFSKHISPFFIFFGQQSPPSPFWKHLLLLSTNPMLQALKDTLSSENTAQDHVHTEFLLGVVHLYENKVFRFGGNVTFGASSTQAFTYK